MITPVLFVLYFLILIPVCNSADLLHDVFVEHLLCAVQLGEVIAP